MKKIIKNIFNYLLIHKQEKIETRYTSYKPEEIARVIWDLEGEA